MFIFSDHQRPSAVSSAWPRLRSNFELGVLVGSIRDPQSAIRNLR
jgi:hypothetical protein